MARLRMTLRLAVVIAMVFQVSAAPVASPDPAPIDDDRPEIIEIIAPAEVAQETLDSLNLGEPNSEQGERNKRTIGILREMFPSLSKIVDQKIQQIVSFLFRTVGRSLLSGAIGGGRGATTSTSSTSGSNQGNKVSISLPTYGPDSDDDDDSDEDDDDSKPNQSVPSVNSRFNADPSEGSTTESTADNEVQASNLEDSERSSSGATTPPSQTSDTKPSESDPSETFSESISTEAASSTAPTPDSELSSSTESIPSTETSSSELAPADLTDPPTTLSSTSSSTESAESDSSVTSDSTPEAEITDSPPSTATPATSGVNAEENLLSEAESQQSEVRVQFADPEGVKTAENTGDLTSDQESAASGVNGAAIDDLSLDDADTDSSDENRNKRFLNFGFGGGDSAAAGSGSGGGSGNFLFDIIRRPAESMARAAGQAFRILTGTDSIGLGITATHTAVRDLPNLNNATKLVAGSGGTEQTDEANASADGDSAKGDTYTEGIPGPVTRLFIIANRGISNLIQDLILRLAQTSERIVNFKARLITSII